MRLQERSVYHWLGEATPLAEHCAKIGLLHVVRLNIHDKCGIEFAESATQFKAFDYGIHNNVYHIPQSKALNCVADSANSIVYRFVNNQSY